MFQTLAQLRAAPHLSVSQLKTFLQCPRKHKLQYIDRVLPQFRPIALAFGTAWHDAIGHHLSTSTKAAPADRDELKAIFRDSLAIAVKSDGVPVLFDDDETLGSATDLGLKMLDTFVERVELPDEVLGVEVPFSLQLVEPNHGDRLDRPLIGALDAIVMKDDKPEVWELKTSKKKWSADQRDYDLQPSAYEIAAEELGHHGADVVLLVATKTKTPAVQVERLVRSKSDRRDLVATAFSVATAIAVGVDHPVRGWSCRGCPVAHACT
jgi:CRISPR/Cas system-associated exonuclease Cas4 (RecB family)